MNPLMIQVEHPLPPHPETAHAARSLASKYRVALNLEAAVPTSKRDQATLDETQPHLLWFESHAWLLKLKEEGMIALQPLPEGFIVPNAAYWPLIVPSQSTQCHDESVSIYIDGSSNGTVAAWSAVVTTHSNNQETFLGCLYGQVTVSPDDPCWYGASTIDNISGELTAMIAAQNIVLRWPIPANFCIRPDLSLSRTVAISATTCRSNPPGRLVQHHYVAGATYDAGAPHAAGVKVHAPDPCDTSIIYDAGARSIPSRWPCPVSLVAGPL